MLITSPFGRTIFHISCVLNAYTYQKKEKIKKKEIEKVESESTDLMAIAIGYG